MTALVALARADTTVMTGDPVSHSPLIVANIVGTMPWTATE
ncbi:MAG TPA: hypothetical protein VF739_04070 [Ktedonobacterales bacterium]